MRVLIYTAKIPGNERENYVIPDVPLRFTFDDALCLIKKAFPMWTFSDAAFKNTNSVWYAEFAGINLRAANQVAYFTAGVYFFKTFLELIEGE